MQGIEGKVIAITGAGTGIGRAAARLLAERGAKVVLGARREEKIRPLADELGGAWIVTDVRKRADVAALVALAQTRFGKLDVMISNAGIAPVSAFDELRVEDWEDMIDVNLKGVLYGIAAALPVFRKQGSGHFVHTISTSGLKIVPLQGVYAGTKNAVRTISEALRQEAGPKLRVTTISPGFIKTDLQDSMTDPKIAAGMREQADKIAIAPEAVARVMAYAIGEPDDVDISEIAIRPTVQG
jgi:NADP-dependent 3-hydroxy acid dehydrogenase YdfG